MFSASEREGHRPSAWIARLLALAMLGCQSSAQQESQDAMLASLPAVAGRTIGPQPGPDRPLPQLMNPYADDAGAAAEGRRLFNWFNCSGCHGGHAGGGMGPSLRDPVWIYGGDAQSIYNSISEGRANGMPAWGTKLPSDEIWKLVTYVMSLNTDREADPPPQNPSFPNSPTATRSPTLEGRR